MNENPSVYVPVLRRTVELGKPVLHHRFLWYVTYDGYELNWVIAKQGLTLPYRGGAIYAHNQLGTFENMYPYFVDRYDWVYSRLSFEGRLLDLYSFWRIDTLSCGNFWYIDPGMVSDSEYLGESSRNYVCTPHAVPPHALRLYHFDAKNFTMRTPKIHRKKGSAHIRPIRDDFDTLVPNEAVNRYISARAA